MTELNPSYGTPFTVRSGNKTPKQVMQEIMNENQNASQQKICKLFAEKIINDPELNMICLQYHLAVNIYNSIDRLKMTPLERRSMERRKEQESYELNKKAKKIIDEMKKGWILDTLIAPYKKTARECTGKELIKAGGALAEIGALVKPNQIVGHHITDSKAQKVYNGYKFKRG